MKRLLSLLLILSFLALCNCKEDVQEKIYFPLKPSKPDQVEVSVVDQFIVP
jgi:hypothetical protein